MGRARQAGKFSECDLIWRLVNTVARGTYLFALLTDHGGG